MKDNREAIIGYTPRGARYVELRLPWGVVRVGFFPYQALHRFAWAGWARIPRCWSARLYRFCIAYKPQGEK